MSGPEGTQSCAQPGAAADVIVKRAPLTEQLRGLRWAICRLCPQILHASTRTPHATMFTASPLPSSESVWTRSGLSWPLSVPAPLTVRVDFKTLVLTRRLGAVHTGYRTKRRCTWSTTSCCRQLGS